jgi:hypothetical protein
MARLESVRVDPMAPMVADDELKSVVVVDVVVIVMAGLRLLDDKNDVDDAIILELNG